ncbi:hypothetical protein CDL12_03250 [Handroanthus impetiginosus]|uniref:DUF868 domain-containing protein n=1 Tax=Handroanthus impetiginosus TaxID=429701 RepID=A0A2G9I2L5_9LAMI|nr:hypothetical protein CDL12_03250 [Handroanthus impetiginosus]
MPQYQHRRFPTPISCFSHRRPSATTNPYLTTCLYNTDVGLFALSWSRTLFGRSLHLHHMHHQHRQASTFHLHMRIKPFPYNKRRGSTKLNLINIHKPATIFWDLSSAKYGSGPEPLSGFYVAIVIDSEIILLVGESLEEAHSVIRSTGAARNRFPSPMILRREHVRGTKLYSTMVSIGGHERNISIECRLVENPRLCFSIDNQRVLQIKHLKWKFRGNESIEIDGNCVQVSWDVYKLLFDHRDNGYALFMFTIFHQKSVGFGVQDDQDIQYNRNNNSKATSLWPQFQPSLGFEFGLGDEKKLMKKNKGGAGLLRRSRRSSSFSSLSSANSSGSWTSSVMEWADSTEEDQLMSLPNSGFSLLVYAWKT